MEVVREDREAVSQEERPVGSKIGGITPRIAVPLLVLGLACCALAGYAVVAVGGRAAGVIGLGIAAVAVLLCIPLAGFTLSQVALTVKGREVATSVVDVQRLKLSDAAAFVRPLTSLRGASAVRIPATPRQGGGMPESPAIDVRPQSSFWSWLTAAQRDDLARLGRAVAFTAGETLSGGGRERPVVVIRSGWAKVCADERIIAFRGPGDLVAEASPAVVVAVGDLDALVLSDGDFADFLSRNPDARLLLDNGVRVGPPARSWAGQNCTILLADALSIDGDHGISGDRMREHVMRIIADGFDRSGIAWSHCHHEDAEHGVLVIIPPETPTRTVAGPVVGDMVAGLVRYNSEGDRARLRVAVHVGPVWSDGAGVLGRAITHAERLGGLPALRRGLVRSGAGLGLVVSDFVYETIVSAGASGLDKAAFRQVKVRGNSLDSAAWIRLF